MESKRRRDVVLTDRVNKVIDLLGSKLMIPEDRLEIAKKSQVFLVDKDTFYDVVSQHIEELGFRIPKELEVDDEKKDIAGAVFEALGISTEEIKEKRRKLMEDIYEKYSMTRGISICDKDGQKNIFINGDEVNEEQIDETLTHELLHSMMDTVNEGTGFNTEYGKYHFLNEATVQLMTLRFKYSDMNWNDFSKSVKGGLIKNNAYFDQVNALLILLEATTFGEKTYSFEELKDLYFDKEMDSGTKAVFLKMSLFSRIPEKIGNNKGMRKDLLNIFETRLEGVKRRGNK